MLTTRIRVRRLLAPALFLMALGGHAFAQEIDDATRSAARQLATQGSEAYEGEKYDTAFDSFSRAYQLVHVPTLGIWVARSLVKMNRWVEASERYLEISRLNVAADAPPEHQKAKDDAAREQQDLLAKIPAVKVVLRNADPSEVFVTLNGKVLQAALIGVDAPVDPGKLNVKGVRGEEVVESSIQIFDRQKREVVLFFKPPAAAKTGAATPEGGSTPAGTSSTDTGVQADTSSGSGQRTLGIVAMGAGGVGLVVGSIFGISAMGKKGDLDKACGSDHDCPPSYQDDVDSYNSKRTISTIGFVGGALLTGVGVTLYLTAGSGSSSSSAEHASDSRSRASSRRTGVGVWLGANGAGLRGSFE